jgi:DtxR family Mn-dependent transcriptional regulator
MKKIIEDYLKIIRSISDKEFVKTTEIAKKLNVTPGNVSQFLKKLAKKELVTHKPYKGVKLTKLGRKYAREIDEKHEISEEFLEKFLKVKEAHPEAEVLEHVVSKEIFKKMKKIVSLKEKAVKLNELKESENGEVLFMKISNHKTLARINAIGIVPGERVKLIRKIKNGPLIVKIKNTKISIGKEIANNIMVIKK